MNQLVSVIGALKTEMKRTNAIAKSFFPSFVQ